MSENNEGVIFTPQPEEEGRIDEFPTLNEEPILIQVSGLTEQTPEYEALVTKSENEGTTEGATEGAVEGATDPEDLNKKNYIKISSTFYIKYVESEEPVEGEEKIEIYKILNPQTGVFEKRKLTDSEKHDVIVKELQESKIKFRNVKHDGNITTNKFGADYRKKRQRKNKMAKASRKANR
jgi:hypothetical protein